MSKINLTYKDRTYTLEFNRNSAALIEKQGFRLNEVESQPVIMVPLLIHGAFIMHHRGLNEEFINNIFDAVAKKSDLVRALMNMYSEVALSYFDDDTEAAEDSGKNAIWAVE